MKYFTYNELTLSKVAQKYLIDNTPTDEIKANLDLLVDKLLDPIREAWGKSIIVNSGYRCPRLNRQLNGSSTSDHMNGLAADITTGTRDSNKLLFELILTLNLDYDQLINEQNYKWIHISFRPTGNRKQILNLK